jgi:AcrR family transcriptional regulator
MDEAKRMTEARTEAKKREHVLAAARQVFLRYGYKRTTMGDIAAEASMSRPALYLLFPSKEDVFGAVMEQLFADMLASIRIRIDKRATAYEKLVFAFDVWAIQPFKGVQASPDAKDVLESSYAFAPALTANAAAEFEDILVSILEPLTVQAELTISSDRIAHILAAAVPGFKNSASSVKELEQMIDGLVMIVLAGLRPTMPGTYQQK